mmetsp:Transcript_4897/g.7949  ORF Transcript_4897/g.7949 Transcript_4897/m.7949 type:complete len:286 (+) Transcript_4897:7-864(+)
MEVYINCCIILWPSPTASRSTPSARTQHGARRRCNTSSSTVLARTHSQKWCATSPVLPRAIISLWFWIGMASTASFPIRRPRRLLLRKSSASTASFGCTARSKSGGVAIGRPVLSPTTVAMLPMVGNSCSRPMSSVLILFASPRPVSSATRVRTSAWHKVSLTGSFPCGKLHTRATRILVGSSRVRQSFAFIRSRSFRGGRTTCTNNHTSAIGPTCLLRKANCVATTQSWHLRLNDLLVLILPMCIVSRILHGIVVLIVLAIVTAALAVAAPISFRAASGCASFA